MSTRFTLAHSRMVSESASSRSGSIKFVDPFAVDQHAPSMGNRSVTTRPIPPSNAAQRSNTIHAARAPQPAGAIKVEQRALLRRAAPVTQFEMVTPPRSPTDMTPREGSRLPIRTSPSTGIKRRSMIARRSCQDQPAASSRMLGAAPTMPSQRTPPSAHSITIPVRKNLSVLGWAESQASFAALNVTSTGRTPGRGALPRTWTGIPSRKTTFRHSTVPTASSQPMAEVEPRRAGSDPEVKIGGPSYPQLTLEERNVLVRKLRVLLKHVGVDSRGLDEWEKLAGMESGGTGRSGNVFGTAVKDSSPYASCQVVLGEHSHTLPICVFASIEEICQRGITTSALFRVAPPPNERTLDKLTQTFDQGPSYGVNVSLAKEDVSNVCALLKFYLRGLPEAALSRSLWPILQQLTLESGSARIAAVQAVLHLQHPVNFSLLVYVLAFLHQLIIHGPKNGLDIPTLAEMFGPALFSPRKGGNLGCMISPDPNGPGPVLVKTFLSARDIGEGTRVMSWVLEHWDEIATGLLSLDIVHGSENDIQTWEANFASVSGSESSGLRLFGTSDGGSEYSEGPSIDELVDPALESLAAFPFPENVTLDQVPVREVRTCIVEMPEMLSQSTRASSPATFWSQDTAPQQVAVSRTVSTASTVAKSDLEPRYIQEMRQRMDSQESELASLRQDLAMIKSRFVLPLPLGDATEPKDEKNAQLETGAELDEDTMPTPRPTSGPQFTSMRELVDSLQSEPATPLYRRTIRAGTLETRATGTRGTPENSTRRDSGYSSSSHGLSDGEILPSNVFLDSAPSTPSPTRKEFYVVNPDIGKDPFGKDTSTILGESNPTIERDVPSALKESDTLATDTGNVEELLTARDALRSALAAMDPVKVQLKAVETELQLRGASPAST